MSRSGITSGKLPPEKQDARQMRALFRRVAPRYGFITRAFSYGMDAVWKRKLVDQAGLPEGALVLDLASGTGDFSLLARRRVPQVRTVAVDLTPEMLILARRGGIGRVVCGDAMGLPFAEEIFDGVFVGYGLRNFSRLETALGEIRRVLRPGGVLATLDFFLPPGRLARQLYLGYLYTQGFFWGLVLHGRPRIYTYIPRSLGGFLTAGEFSAMLGRQGFGPVWEQTRLRGGIGVHVAVRQ